MLTGGGSTGLAHRPSPETLALRAAAAIDRRRDAATCEAGWCGARAPRLEDDRRRKSLCGKRQCHSPLTVNAYVKAVGRKRGPEKGTGAGKGDILVFLLLGEPSATISTCHAPREPP